MMMPRRRQRTLALTASSMRGENDPSLRNHSTTGARTVPATRQTIVSQETRGPPHPRSMRTITITITVQTAVTSTRTASVAPSTGTTPRLESPSAARPASRGSIGTTVSSTSLGTLLRRSGGRISARHWRRVRVVTP